MFFVPNSLSFKSLLSVCYEVDSKFRYYHHQLWNATNNSCLSIPSYKTYIWCYETLHFGTHRRLYLPLQNQFKRNKRTYSCKLVLVFRIKNVIACCICFQWIFYCHSYSLNITWWICFSPESELFSISLSLSWISVVKGYVNRTKKNVSDYNTFFSF